MPNERKSGLSWDIGQVIIGILVGIAIALPFFLISTEVIVSFIRDNALNVIVFGSFATAVLLFLLALRKPITKWLFGISTKSAEALTGEAIHLAEAIADRDVEAVKQNGKDLTLQFAAMYGWLTARRTILSVILVFGGSLAGVMGSALLLQQNKILEAQNRNLDLQLKTSLLTPILQEANRRVPLYSQMTTIFAKIDEEVANIANERLAPEHHAEDIDDAYELERAAPFSPVKLSDRLYSDIIGLSLQLKPYLHFDSQRLGAGGITEIADDPESIFENLVFLSPERGMLLHYLIENGVQLDDGVLDGADFTYSDLRGFRVESPFFADFDTQEKFTDPDRFVCFAESNSVFRRTLEIGFPLDHTDLSGAVVSGVTIDPRNVVLSGVDIRHTVLQNTAYDGSSFAVDVHSSSFYDVELRLYATSEIHVRLDGVDWHAFNSACLVRHIDEYAEFISSYEPDEFTLTIIEDVRLFPIEVYSEGMWNGASYDVGKALDTKNYTQWIPTVLTELLVAHGIKLNVFGVPADHKIGDEIFAPEAFGFLLSQ